ncbi:MAG: hypothetical protein ACM3PU_13000 [Gemmatimonadota bacterium]
MGATIEAVPPTREFTAAWVAYALFAVGAFIWWPALIGVIVCLAKRGAPDSAFIDSHYRWLARTFGWSLLGYVLCLGIIVSAAWPLARDVIVAYQQSGGDWGAAGTTIQLEWESIFLTAGLALAGAFGLIGVWFWYIYRVVRGAFRLGAARPVP